MKKINKKSNFGKIIKRGVALGAVAGAAYMLLGPDGKKNQIKLKAFANKVKDEVLKDTKTIVRNAKVVKKEFTKDAEKVKRNIKKIISKKIKDLD